MLKKASILTIIFCSITSLASLAFANDYGRQRYYIGGDYEYTSLDYGSDGSGIDYDDVFADTLHGGNIHVGYRVGQYLGLEGGYFLTDELTENSDPLGTPATTETKVQGLYFDVIGYYPITSDNRLEALGAIGLGYYRIDSDVTVGTVTNRAADDAIAARLGLGAQYHLTDHISARGFGRYVTMEEPYWTFGGGLNYSF